MLLFLGLGPPPTGVGKCVLDRVFFPRNLMLAAAAEVTTGLEPFTAGSVILFQLQPWINELPWNLAGGTVNLILADPTGNEQTIPGTITGWQIQAQWTVGIPIGTWTRCWDCTDASGVRLISQPIAFSVETSPF